MITVERIQLKDIDLTKLKKMPIQGTRSTVYDAGDICVKIFENIDKEELDKLYRKIREIEGITIDGTIFPIDIILENGILKGFTMEKFENSINLLDYFTCTEKVSCEDIFKAIKKASEILKNIHNHNIIVQDLTFDNILINSEGVIKYSDFDGYAVNNITSPYTSLILKRYIVDYRKDKIEISKSTDRISMMICTFQLLFLKEIQKVSKRSYQKLANNITTIKNLEPYKDMLKDRTHPLKLIPYIDELIDSSDNYIIDRIEQIGRVKALYYRVKDMM